MGPLDRKGNLEALGRALGADSVDLLEGLRGELRHHDRAVGLCVGTVLMGALALHRAEKEGEGPITTFGDALWSVLDMVSTVGSGTCSPVTPAGRAVGGLLMLVGTPLFARSRDKAAALLEDFVERLAEAATGEGKKLATPEGYPMLEEMGLGRREEASGRQALQELLEEVARDEKNEIDLLVRMARTLPSQHAGLQDVSKRLADAEALLAEVVERSRSQTEALDELVRGLHGQQAAREAEVERVMAEAEARRSSRAGGDDASFRGERAKNVFDVDFVMLDEDGD